MGKGKAFRFYGMGITDQYNTKAGKELETGQTCVQLASVASLAMLKIPEGKDISH